MNRDRLSETGSPNTDESPYDGLWTWAASATIGFGTFTFLILSTGAPSLVPSANALAQDDVKVVVAFWGALVCSGGLLALGLLATVFVRSGYARPGLLCPRFKLIEEKARSSIVAQVGLSATLLVPLATLLAALVAYADKSRVADWNATVPLDSGFLSSRLAALGTDCFQQPCFRMAPMDGESPFAHQWFSWSDPVLIVAILGALIAWLVFARRVRLFHRSYID